MMLLQSPVSYSGFATNMGTTSEHSARIPYSHADLPKHVEDLQKIPENPQAPKPGDREQAVPMQRVVFDRKYIDLFNEAAKNPEHRLRRAAERVMQGFSEAAERAEVATLSQASREYHIPLKNLSDWVRKGLLPYTREKNAILLRRESLDKVAPVYHEATEQGKLAAPILRKMHDELFPVGPKSSQE
jgi:hypothetical protein